MISAKRYKQSQKKLTLYKNVTYKFADPAIGLVCLGIWFASFGAVAFGNMFTLALPTTETSIDMVVSGAYSYCMLFLATLIIQVFGWLVYLLAGIFTREVKYQEFKKI